MQKDQPNLRWLFVFLLSFNHKIPKLGIKMEHVIQTSKTYKQESILDFQAVKKKHHSKYLKIWKRTKMERCFLHKMEALKHTRSTKTQFSCTSEWSCLLHLNGEVWIMHLSDQQWKPWQTDRIIIRIRAMMIPKTMSLIFMFCSHIFLFILVPCCLKSCACIQRTEYIIMFSLTLIDCQEIWIYEVVLSPQLWSLCK